MQEKHQDKTPPRHRKVDAEPGQPDYQPGVTGTPDQPVYDEDAEAKKTMEKQKQETRTPEEEDTKIVNEQEQDQVINDEDPPGESNTGDTASKTGENPTATKKSKKQAR